MSKALRALLFARNPAPRQRLRHQRITNNQKKRRAEKAAKSVIRLFGYSATPDQPRPAGADPRTHSNATTAPLYREKTAAENQNASYSIARTTPNAQTKIPVYRRAGN